MHDPYAEYAARVCGSRRRKGPLLKTPPRGWARQRAYPRRRPGRQRQDRSATLTNDGSFAFGATSLPTPQGDGQQYGFRFNAVNAGSSTDMSMGGSASDADLARNEGGFFDTRWRDGTLSHLAPRRMAKLAEKRAAE